MIGKKIIGIDLDGVIIDHKPAKLRLAADFGFALEPWQTNTNLMKNFLPVGQYRELQSVLYDETTDCAPTVAGARECLLAAISFGFEPHLISRRNRDSVQIVEGWLKRRGFEDVFNVDHVHFCQSDGEKAEICSRLSVVSFVDDKLSVLLGLSSSVRRILFAPDGAADRISPPSDIVLAQDWPSCLDAVLGS